MPDETIAIAADHAGYALKSKLSSAIESLGYRVLDLGTHSSESVDYPDYTDALARALAGG